MASGTTNDTNQIMLKHLVYMQPLTREIPLEHPRCLFRIKISLKQQLHIMLCMRHNTTESPSLRSTAGTTSVSLLPVLSAGVIFRIEARTMPSLREFTILCSTCSNVRCRSVTLALSSRSSFASDTTLGTVIFGCNNVGAFLTIRHAENKGYHSSTEYYPSMLYLA